MNCARRCRDTHSHIAAAAAGVLFLVLTMAAQNASAQVWGNIIGKVSNAWDEPLAVNKTFFFDRSSPETRIVWTGRTSDWVEDDDGDGTPQYTHYNTRPRSRQPASRVTLPEMAAAESPGQSPGEGVPNLPFVIGESI